MTPSKLGCHGQCVLWCTDTQTKEVTTNIIRQTLDPDAAPIEASDRIFTGPDGTLNLVLDDDIFDKHFGEADDE